MLWWLRLLWHAADLIETDLCLKYQVSGIKKHYRSLKWEATLSKAPALRDYLTAKTSQYGGSDTLAGCLATLYENLATDLQNAPVVKLMQASDMNLYWALSMAFTDETTAQDKHVLCCI
jgi:hypothetical protein